MAGPTENTALLLLCRFVATEMCLPRRCVAELLKFWGEYINHDTSYHYYYYNNYIHEPHKALDLHRPAARLRTSLTLVAPKRRRHEFTMYSLLRLTLCRKCPLFVFLTNSDSFCCPSLLSLTLHCDLIHSLSLTSHSCSRLSTHQLQLTPTTLQVKVTDLLYDWRFTADQFVLVLCPLSLKTRHIFSFFQLNPCGHCPHVTLSLTKEWVCLL
jgi:hypothetical protein